MNVFEIRKLKDVPKYELSGINRHINISRSRNPQPTIGIGSISGKVETRTAA
jgi:hypothetical protein